MKPAAYIILHWCLLLLTPGIVFAEEARLALVIGNSEYADSPLSNPIRDAKDMASVLEDLGFTVMLHTDANRRDMGKAIRDFGKTLKKERGIGLFYYAGHGMQIDNRNFLIPIDTPLEEEDEVPYESIDVGSVLAKMESAGNSLNVIILDACRNNPFPRRFRSSNRGLARVEAPVGSLVVYATAPGAVAADGDGRNGVFTGALLEQLRTEGLSLTQTIRRTRASVVKATNGQQVPWESSSLLQDYYLQGAPQTQLATRLASEDDPAAAARAAASVQRQTEPSGADTATATSEPANTLAMLDSDQDNSVPPKANVNNSNAIVEAKPAVVKPEGLRRSGTATLTVEVEPSDARVRIMNIVEKYKPGIVLDRTQLYDVYVTRQGYQSYREKIWLEDEATALGISLTPIAETEPDMIAVAGGSYPMGCTEGDSLCEAYEHPARSVNVAPFSIALTETTVGQYDEFVASTGYITDAEKSAGGNAGCFVWSDKGGISRSEAAWAWDKSKNWRNPGYRQTPQHPVTCISWNDANRYAQWLAGRTGRNYALPTEAEWELAARAGSRRPFGAASSSRELCASANVADRSNSPTGSKWSRRINCTDGFWFSAPVASFKGNDFGLFDMQGNAWEWVADVWSDNYSDAPTNGSANTRGQSQDRVLRGGGWDSEGRRSRVSSRSKGNAQSRAAMTGFRLVIR